MKGYIYKYTFPNGKIYIGQTRRPIEKRHAEHFNPSTGPNNPSFWNACQTVGTPKLTILETVEADNVTALVNLLNEKESAYIFLLRATDPSYGYNRVPTATVSSPDTNILNKEYIRMCAQAVEEKRPFFDSVSEKLYSKNPNSLTEEEREFVNNYVYNNNLFELPEDNQLQQEDKTSLDDDYEDFWLGEALDYAIWHYTEEMYASVAHYIREHAYDIILDSKRGKLKRIIQQLDMEGEVIREFAYIDEISSTFKVNRIDNIFNVLKGRQKTAYGFHWRYKPE